MTTVEGRAPASVAGRRLAARRLGSAGPEISVIGFGAWAVGGPYEFGWGPVDDGESVAAIRHAVESGITWVDTAPVYGLGHSEEVVARALEPWTVGEDVLVFTKCGRGYYGSSTISSNLRPESIRREWEASARRLRVERIDLFQFHWPDPDTGTEIEDSWGTMAELLDEGKVRWAGVSNFGVELLERCEAVRHVDSVQPPLNLLNRAAAEEVVPWCREHGAGVIAYAPMANGLLSGRFDAARLDEQLAPEDWRRRSPNFQEPRLSRNLDLVERLRPLAARLGLTPAALAVAWTLSVPGVTGAIAGARRPSQVVGWIEAASTALGPQDLAEIERAVAAAGV